MYVTQFAGSSWPGHVHTGHYSPTHHFRAFAHAHYMNSTWLDDNKSHAIINDHGCHVSNGFSHVSKHNTIEITMLLTLFIMQERLLIVKPSHGERCWSHVQPHSCHDSSL